MYYGSYMLVPQVAVYATPLVIIAVAVVAFFLGRGTTKRKRDYRGRFIVR